MKLASYKATRPGLQGVFNRLIRWRLSGLYSHSEVVFGPGDGVGAFMPDGNCLPDAAGALWCASSVAAERLPAWSPYRAGKLGGVRFKRIVLDPAKWDVIPYPADPRRAAAYFRDRQGHLYNWRLVAKFVAWAMPLKDKRLACSEAGAAAGGYTEAWRLDPCTLRAVVRSLPGLPLQRF